MIRSIHPFPARMAPDLAIASLQELDPASRVLDPMAGSGTVVRQAAQLGHYAIGFDLDPLAVLMTKVWTQSVEDERIAQLYTTILARAKCIPADCALPWVDEETKEFMEFWFAPTQRDDLTRLAQTFYEFQQTVEPQDANALDVLRLALSRIIITKEQGASLARDVSHSRPHKVAQTSTYDVMAAYGRSVRAVRRLLAQSPPTGSARMYRGDARFLEEVRDGEIDAVLTSPPYLNAIDYMRGHRLSLVWLGHRLSDLRTIRSTSIGAERGPDCPSDEANIASICLAMGAVHKLPKRYKSMITRYAQDLQQLASETARVLRPQGQAIFVVGNSCLKGIFVRNSEGVAKAASLSGLRLVKEVERELPVQNRYLPTPASAAEPLGKRMRTETILTFQNT